MLWTLLLSSAIAQKQHQPAIIKRNFQSQPQDIIIVNTLDGCLHGIKKSNGKLLWSQRMQETPMIKVKDQLHSQEEASETSLSNHVERVIFIPEPAGNGDLYYVEPGQKMKKFDISLKEMVANNLGVMDSRHMFTGRKDTEIFAIDPLHGNIISKFGQSGPSFCQESTKNAIFIGRTEYQLNIWDKETDKLLWNISYVEFSPTGNTLSNRIEKTETLQADVNGQVVLRQQDKEMIFKTEFDSPVVSAFSISSDDTGFHLHKFIEQVKDTDLVVNNGYVGNHDGTFYLMSDRHFPHIDKMIEHEDYDDKCEVGSPNYPACLIGSYQLEIPMIEHIVDAVPTGWPWFRIGIALLVLSIPLLPLSFFPKIRSWWKGNQMSLPTHTKHVSEVFVQSEELSKSTTSGENFQQQLLPSVDLNGSSTLVEQELEDQEDSTMSRASVASRRSVNTSGLKSLSVTEKVLGYGSHGTVVLEGTFEGRPVAIKRMLSDFYEVADHEVKMLQESDLHPNVVRYYFKEQSEGFMYIALEYCAGSMCDFVTRKDIPEVHMLYKNLSYQSIFKQIMSGILHLHSLNIVHRDIKPQNILISQVKQNGKIKVLPRILISDFGLGKRLTDDQSSFHNTIIPGGGPAGTAGWRAPECLLANALMNGSSTDGSDGWKQPDGKSVPEVKKSQTRITRAIDIFSAGCVFYYIASNGHHPYGERFSREINILKGNFRLQHLDSHKDSALLKDLIKVMISKDPSKRPTAEQVLRHPFFWTTNQQLSFLQDVSDRLEVEPRDPPSGILKTLKRNANKTIGTDWYRKFNRSVIENMSKYRKYDGGSVQDLLRAIRNKKHHYQDLPDDIKKELGSIPDGFLHYFTSRFPNLLLHVFYFVQNNPKLVNDPLFHQYFS